MENSLAFQLWRVLATSLSKPTSTAYVEAFMLSVYVTRAFLTNVKWWRCEMRLSEDAGYALFWYSARILGGDARAGIPLERARHRSSSPSRLFSSSLAPRRVRGTSSLCAHPRPRSVREGCANKFRILSAYAFLSVSRVEGDGCRDGIRGM